MNKIYWILITTSLLLFACSKSEPIPVLPDENVEAFMRDYFKNELKCTTPSMMQTNLFQGIYEGQTVYYVDIVCPACNTLPPKSGYTYKLEEIVFSDFRNVTDHKMVYDSCTKKFAD